MPAPARPLISRAFDPIPSWRVRSPVARAVTSSRTTTPLPVQLTIAMAHAVLLEAGLSFLGLGAQPPTASWGAMLSRARNDLIPPSWYGFYPGVALLILLLGLFFVADSARTALDPHRKDS